MCAASVVTRRARLGSRTLGAHSHEATPVEPTDGPAARANRPHIDHGVADRQSPLYIELGGVFGAAIHNQTDITTGAAHVKGYQVVFPSRHAEELSSDHPRDQTGQQRVERTVRYDVQQGHAAV